MTFSCTVMTTQISPSCEDTENVNVNSKYVQCTITKPLMCYIIRPILVDWGKKFSGDTGNWQMNNDEFHRLSGREFQAVRPATQREQRPNIKRCWRNINIQWHCRCIAASRQWQRFWCSIPLCIVKLCMVHTGEQLCRLCTAPWVTSIQHNLVRGMWK